MESCGRTLTSMPFSSRLSGSAFISQYEVGAIFGGFPAVDRRVVQGQIDGPGFETSSDAVDAGEQFRLCDRNVQKTEDDRSIRSNDRPKGIVQKVESRSTFGRI